VICHLCQTPYNNFTFHTPALQNSNDSAFYPPWDSKMSSNSFMGYGRWWS